MIKYLYMVTMTTSVTFSMMSHPLSMGLMLLIQVTLIAMITGTMTKSFWFSYILFIIMIGGMLVLFIYMTSIASNEKFMYSVKILAMAMITLLMSMTLLSIFPMEDISLLKTTDLYPINKMPFMNLSMSKYLNFPTNWIMMTMIIYLLITLIAVVKITNVMYGPLRQKF